MRLNCLLLVSSLACFAACSSAESSSPSAGDPSSPTTGAEGEGGGAPEPPLTARPVCPTVAASDTLGKGCSGVGHGEDLCALSDATCEDTACLYDSRTPGKFSFYCAPSCVVGDATVCPMGFECVAPTASCSSGATGVCARRAGFECDEDVPSGELLEGPKGELLHLSSATGRVSLGVVEGKKVRPLTSWDGSYPDVRTVLRSGDKLLIVTSEAEVLVSGGKAKATKREPTGYGAAFGVAKDGSFVLLDSSGSESFAAVLRRSEDGAWTELGPTRQRVSTIVALKSGFVARCKEGLCASADGETFSNVALPSGATLDETTKLAAAGASPEDFYLALGGRLYHHRKGAWVEEGPRAATSASDPSKGRPDVLRAFADGTIVYHTYNGTEYATYVGAGDCWRFAPSGNLDAAALVKDAFVWADSYDGLCRRPAR